MVCRAHRLILFYRCPSKILCIPMAICKDSKYSLNELQHFTDRIENVLQHDLCRQEFRQFLKEILKRPDLIKVLDFWEKANDIKRNTPGSPERKRKSQELEEEVEDDPTFCCIANNKSNIVVAVNEKASESLAKKHRYFIHYLRKKYL